jgi:2,4-dienoyl-CoA reductase-like NADH-dependent reductase (Old Yellow Enzyme family)
MNRARIIFEILKAIRARVTDPTFSIGMKLNSVEFQDGGFSSEDCAILCSELENRGKLDYIELSGGTYQVSGFSYRRESTRKRESFFLEFAEMIIPHLKKTRVYVTGGLRSAAAMVNALQTVDGIGLGRPVCHEFDLAQKILDGKVESAMQCQLLDDDFTITNIAASIQ